MTQNLAEYIPLALRMGITKETQVECVFKKIQTQSELLDSAKVYFLVDARFSLRLDELG